MKFWNARFLIADRWTPQSKSFEPRVMVLDRRNAADQGSGGRLLAQEESLKGPAVVGGWMPNGCESGWQRAAPDTPRAENRRQPYFIPNRLRPGTGPPRNSSGGRRQGTGLGPDSGWRARREGSMSLMKEETDGWDFGRRPKRTDSASDDKGPTREHTTASCHPGASLDRRGR